jgi:hypothetical protein
MPFKTRQIESIWLGETNRRLHCDGRRGGNAAGIRGRLHGEAGTAPLGSRVGNAAPVGGERVKPRAAAACCRLDQADGRSDRPRRRRSVELDQRHAELQDFAFKVALMQDDITPWPWRRGLAIPRVFGKRREWGEETMQGGRGVPTSDRR